MKGCDGFDGFGALILNQAPDELNLPSVIEVMRRDAGHEVGDRVPAFGPAREVASAERGNLRPQLPVHPIEAIDVRAPETRGRPGRAPASKRHTAYSRYAQWTTSSWMLCRPGAGRRVAMTGVTPRIAPPQVRAVPRRAAVRLIVGREQLLDDGIMA